MEAFLGKKYELVDSENYEEFLKFLGVNYVQRKIASTLKPVQSLTRNEDGTYNLHFNSSVASHAVKFTPGVEFEDTKPNGMKVKGVITLEDNKLIQTQVEDKGKATGQVFEFFPDKLVVTSSGVGLDVEVKRNFKLVN